MFDLWQSVLEEIRQNVSETAFSMWFVGSKFLGVEEGVAKVGVPSVFFINQITKKYDAVVIAALKKCGADFKEVQYVVDASTKTKVMARETTSEGRRGDRLAPVKRSVLSPLVENKPKSIIKNPRSSETGLSERYQFDNYVIGSNNELAMSVAKAVVERPGQIHNPLYIYGGAGLGKTHLIQAIGNEIIKKHGKAVSVKYLTTDQFFRSHVEGARKRENLTDEYRKYDVLIMDDIQFLQGKDKSQIDFFHTFNELFLSGRQIIFSSDRMPMELKELDSRLTSRMIQGMCVDIQMPDFETRCAILQAKAEWDGIELSYEAAEFIANNVRTNIRELEGMYNQLMALSSLKNISPDDVIRDGYLNTNQVRRVSSLTPKQIVEKTALYFRIKPEDIYSKCRKKEIMLPRKVSIYLMKEELKMSFPKIGVGEFGHKDHTSALSSYKGLVKDLEKDVVLREDVANIRNSIFVEK